MAYHDYEPFLAMIKISGAIQNNGKIQDMVYILQSLGYPLNEDFSLYTKGLYSERLALKIETMKRLKLIEEKESLYKTLKEVGVDIKNYESWKERIQELNRQLPEDLYLLAVSLYLRSVGYGKRQMYNKLAELGFIDKRKKNKLSRIRKNLEELCYA